jgi:hypothetical protein
MTFDPTAGLRRFFDQMDSDDPYSVVATMRPDFRFIVFFSTEEGMTEFAGDHAAWDGYMAARPVENRPVHRLDIVSGSGLVATSLGRTVLDDDLVATFTATLEFDESGQIARYFAARSTDLNFLPGLPV